MRLTFQVPEWATALASDLTDMHRDPQAVRPGETIEQRLPDDVYFQYGFLDQDGKLQPDPANEERDTSVWYGEVSVARGPDYRPGELVDTPDEVARGSVDRLKIDPASGDGEPWRVTVYTPADADGELPLVITQDGVAFYRIGKPHVIAAALRARGGARPARFVFIEPHDRDSEYGYDDAYQRFLADTLEDELTSRYPSAAERVYLGASLGAIASAQAAIRRVTSAPSLAQSTSVLAYSGAFKGEPGDDDYYRSNASWLLDEARGDAELPGRWHLEVGTLEWLLESNRQVASALEARGGVSVELVERSAGHNWVSWRNGLADGLRFALG